MVSIRDEIKKEIHDKYVEQLGCSWSGKFRITPEGINELKQQFLNDLFYKFSFYIFFYTMWSSKDFTNDNIRFFLLSMSIINLMAAMENAGYIINIK